MSILVSPVSHHVGWRVWVCVFVKAQLFSDITVCNFDRWVVAYIHSHSIMIRLPL